MLNQRNERLKIIFSTIIKKKKTRILRTGEIHQFTCWNEKNITLKKMDE